jgi:hypothetical protein
MVVESHIFVKRKQDGTFKSQQISGNKQRGFVTMEDASSPTVSSEAVMLTCVVDANENRLFVQTVVEDKKDRTFICIHGPLVDILVSIAPSVYGPYVADGKNGKKQLMSNVDCLV